MDLFGILRDYTWRVLPYSFLLGFLYLLEVCRYSPAFCLNLFNNKLIHVRLNKFTLKKKIISKP